MAKLKVSEVEPGMILLDDVLDENDILLIGAGTVLSDNHIDFLNRKLVFEVNISSTEDSDEVPVQKKNAYRIPKEEPSDVEEKYKATVIKFKSVYTEFKLGRVPIYQEIDDALEPLYEAILNDDLITRKIWQIHAYDDYTFDHSVRVSMISGLLAKWCGLGDEKIKEAALAGLLHDIGKCNIPDQILNKPDSLTVEEFKVMKTHAILGYILIKDIPNISYDVLQGVMQHHERVDGSGYPNGLKGNEINYLAKIVAVADVYCAMTQDRVYKKAMHTFEAMSYILEKCHSSLDFSMSKTFLANVSHFYIGHKVILNNDQHGEIIMTYKDDPARPLVRVGEEYIDLRRHIELEIVSMIE
ncbi:HD-GYP domain-containing protein [Fusibacter bizertensis]